MKPLAALLFLLAFCAQVSGWGGEGHQIVALIAEEHLTPEAVEGIRDLLGEGVFISDAEIASWADEVKRERGRPSTSSWHYVNIPFTAPSYDAERDSPRKTDIIEATASQIAAISDISLSKEKRAEALKFVVHLIGDLHQPLHCVERDGDKGGNSVLCWLLERKGKASNLHSIWDTALLMHIKNGARVLPYSKRLNVAMTDEQKQAWLEGDLVAWANESHKLARDHVYRGVPVPTANQMPPVLDEKYVEAAAPIINGQLQRAGLRLARVLNEAFAR